MKDYKCEGGQKWYAARKCRLLVRTYPHREIWIWRGMEKCDTPVRIIIPKRWAYFIKKSPRCGFLGFFARFQGPQNKKWKIRKRNVALGALAVRHVLGPFHPKRWAYFIKKRFTLWGFRFFARFRQMEKIRKWRMTMWKCVRKVESGSAQHADWAQSAELFFKKKIHALGF